MYPVFILACGSSKVFALNLLFYLTSLALNDTMDQPAMEDVWEKEVDSRGLVSEDEASGADSVIEKDSDADDREHNAESCMMSLIQRKFH